MSANYEVVAYRDGKWWTFEIPELSSPSPRGGDHRIVAMGQARTTAEIADEARDLAAIWTDVDEAEVSVQVTYKLPAGVNEAVEHARELDAVGQAAIDEAAMLRRNVVRQLRTTVGLSQADAAAVLGVSRQRIQQLEASTM